MDQNGCFVTENPMNMDDLEVPLFQETSIYLFLFFFGGLPPVIKLFDPHIIRSSKPAVRPNSGGRPIGGAGLTAGIRRSRLALVRGTHVESYRMG